MGIFWMCCKKTIQFHGIPTSHLTQLYLLLTSLCEKQQDTFKGLKDSMLQHIRPVLVV